MDLKNLAILLSAAINLFLGFFIFSKGRDKLVNRIYGLLAFGVFFWAFVGVIYRVVPEGPLSIFWAKMLYTAPIIIVASFLYFTYIFPLGQVSKKKTLLIILIASAMLYVTGFTNGIVGNITIPERGEKIVDFGGWYLIYSFFISSYFIWGYFNLIKKMLASSGIVRIQIKYIFWGTFLASTLGMITNLILPSLGNFNFNWVGQILSLIMVVFIAYAIIRHRLMDAKLVMRRSSVFIASLLSIIIPAFFIKHALISIFGAYYNWMDVLILAIGIFVFTPLKHYYFRLSNTYLFSSLYDSKKVIANLSDQMRSILLVEKIYKTVADILTGSFHNNAIGILIYNKKKKAFSMQFNSGFDAAGLKPIKNDPEINDLYITRNKILILEELRETANGRYKDFLDAMAKLKVEVLAPLNVKNKTIGLIALGAKEAGDMYNDEDLDVLKIVSAQMAIALENAILYEETRNFNQKLRQEVEVATADLREANEKLKKLDAAKSEFISIASHQLRTPLTAIKGYVSMLLEGDFGELSPMEHTSLEKVFDSNERLIKLVENLLNVSRIESGRLQFNFEEIQLEKMVESVMDELSGNAAKKNLELKYIKPENDLPKVNIDEEKVRQVVMNLIDNSIKYTKKGGVTVSLKHIDNAIEFSVSDTGMGISPTDLPNLFQKFSRGTGTSLVHTEGTGLGLYVARQMMEAHHGKIWAESPGEGQGSKFCFRLPVIQAGVNPS